MIVYITRKVRDTRPSDKYLVSWTDASSGCSYSDWHETLADVHEYFDKYDPQYVRVNF